MERRSLLGAAGMAFVAAVAGCGPSPGAAGLWELRVGGKARIVADEGASEVVIDSLVEPPAKGKRPARKAEAPKTEPVRLASGARVEVVAVDGDDARIKVEDGDHAGAIYWIECRRLKALD